MDFRCFSCANEACPLSGRLPGENVLVCPCPVANCSESMKIKKLPKGGYLLSCTNQICGGKWWFPKFIRTGNIDLNV
jgi:hypothetical protein